MRTSNPPAQLTPMQLRVRDVLLDWDPIGIRHIGQGWPVDEYDDLIDPILAAVSNGPAVAELAADLHTVLTADYGLQLDVTDCSPVAVSLLEQFGGRQSVAPSRSA